MALILVLWTFAAVAVLAAEFARAMHDEAMSTRNFKEQTRARLVAMAGMNEVILAVQEERKQPKTLDDEVLTDDEIDDPVSSLSRGGAQWQQLRWRGNAYEARVVDEGGKLALNSVEAPTLQMILDNLDVPKDEADIIADSIVDWRDPDDLHQPNGAESDYYEGLDRPYKAKNAEFDSVDELLLVRGVTNEIYYGHDDVPGLREIFSVFTKGKGVNRDSLTPAVIRAITGMDPDTAADLSDPKNKNKGAGDQLDVALQAAGIPSKKKGGDSRPSVVTIEAKVKDLSGTVVLSHIGATMRFSGESLKVFRWYDSIFDDSDQSGSTAVGAASAS